MFACVSICVSGPQPFSRETVSAAFSRIRIPVFLSLAGILGGLLIRPFLPGDSTGKAPLSGTRQATETGSPSGTRKYLPLCLLCAALGLLLLGLFTGGADGVLTKAIHICTECIGLG